MIGFLAKEDSEFMDPVTARLRHHYGSAFQAHGATSLGVDWGNDVSRLELRYEKMLAVCAGAHETPPSMLDAGCGYGGLLAYAERTRRPLDYTGIEVCREMIDAARGTHPKARFLEGDVLELDHGSQYDYVVCNGILTQKLETPGSEMDVYAARLVRKLFSLARVGVAFNVMTTKVNYFSNNLYYRNPAELLAWCMTEITPRIRLDHSYPLYEFTVYLFH